LSVPRIFTPAIIVPRMNHVLKPLSRRDYFSSLLRSVLMRKKADRLLKGQDKAES